MLEEALPLVWLGIGWTIDLVEKDLHRLTALPKSPSVENTPLTRVPGSGDQDALWVAKLTRTSRGGPGYSFLG